MSTITSLTFWNALQSPHGHRQSNVPWDKFFEQLTQPLDWRADLHPGWSPSTFVDNKRAANNVERVHALVLDVDGGWSIDGAREALKGFYGIIHTSKSHTDEIHRFRIVLPLTRPVSAFEYGELWRRVDTQWPAHFDPACKDASRFWFLPGGPSNDEFTWAHLTGAPLDPDEWLAKPLAAETTGDAYDSGSKLESRAIAYIATMDPAIEGSGGSIACFRVASTLVRRFALPEGVALDILRSEYNPRCVPPWSEKELKHKIASAIKSGKAPMGDLRDARRDSGESSSTSSVPAEVVEPDDLSAAGAESPQEATWKRHGVRRMADLLNDVYERMQRKEKAPSCTTGHGDVDDLIGGYRPGKVAVLGAATNWGKSSWAVMAVDENLRRGKRVLLVSGEDDGITYGKRILARRSGLNAMELRDEVFEGIDDAEIEQKRHRAWSTVCGAEDEPWFLDGVGTPAESLARVVAELCEEQPYDLVIVDYLQAFRCAQKRQDRRNEVTAVARVFTDAIKKAGAAGLLLSQIKRLDSDTREPTKHDLKESGDVENMAEHVLIGWHGQQQRLIKVDKNKDGPVEHCAMPIPFDTETASFRLS